MRYAGAGGIAGGGAVCVQRMGSWRGHHGPPTLPALLTAPAPPPPPQDARDTEIKNLPSLESMVAGLKVEAVDPDDDLTADFKAEKISAETVVLNEEGKKMPLPPKAH